MKYETDRNGNIAKHNKTEMKKVQVSNGVTLFIKRTHSAIFVSCWSHNVSSSVCASLHITERPTSKVVVTFIPPERPHSPSRHRAVNCGQLHVSAMSS